MSQYTRYPVLGGGGGGGGMAIGGAVTGGTANSILFVDGSGDLAQNNSAFYWDDSNTSLNLTSSMTDATSVLTLNRTYTTSIIGGSAQSINMTNNDTSSRTYRGLRVISTVGAPSSGSATGILVSTANNSATAGTLKGLDIGISNSGTATESYTVYIQGAASGTVSSTNRALHVNAGASYFGGQVAVSSGTNNLGVGLSVTSTDVSPTGTQHGAIQSEATISNASSFPYAAVSGKTTAAGNGATAIGMVPSVARGGYANVNGAGILIDNNPDSSWANYYGLYIAGVSGGASGDNQAIHVDTGTSYFGGNIQAGNLTASRAVVTDASKNLASSSTTGTQLGYLASATAAIADTTNTGLLSSTDWNTFNNKQAAGSYALTDLSNLASTAVNVTVIPGTDNSIDLGSTAKSWKSLYLQNIKNSSGTVIAEFNGGNAPRLLDTSSVNSISWSSRRLKSATTGADQLDWTTAGTLLAFAKLKPNGDFTYDLGDSTNYWTNAYIGTLNLKNSGTTINTILSSTSITLPSANTASSSLSITQGGDAIALYSRNVSGAETSAVRIETGNSTSSGNANSGAIRLLTGTTFNAGTGVSGLISIATGDTQSTAAVGTGAVTIATGSTTVNASCNSGNVSIQSGGAGGNSSSSGTVTITTGASYTTTGSVTISTGAPATTGTSGAVTVGTGNGGGRASGATTIKTGTSSGTVVTGALAVNSGNNTNAGAGQSGDVTVNSGSVAGTAASGATTVSTGASTAGASGGATGALTLSTGNSTSGASGNIVILPGTAGGTRGIVKIRGTQTNDAAAAGDVGEYIESIVSTPANTPATGVWGDITSISLTAGDWDVVGNIFTQANGATVSQVRGFIGTASGNSTTGFVTGSNNCEPGVPTASTHGSGAIPSYRVSISSTTTYYLKVQANFSAGTPQAAGRISARRVR
jgi:hypothetical protein